MTTSDYASFLAEKRRRAPERGQHVQSGDIHPSLFDWQNLVVRRAVAAGRYALFEDAGLGKTRQQIEWCRLSAHTSLIVAPLAVCPQTVREGAAIDVGVRYVRSQKEVDGPGVYITNYEMAGKLDAGAFGAVALDESSILAHADSKTRRQLTTQWSRTPARLACSATPMPNDIEELTRHAEYLGICTAAEMRATYFVNDGKNWRLKGHAADPMFRWMAGWAVAMRYPSDLGYADDGYVLPPPLVTTDIVSADVEVEGQLFATDLGGVSGAAKVRRSTLVNRVDKALARVASEPGEPWILWCGLNAEAELLAKELGNAGYTVANVEGKWSPEDKASAVEAFTEGDIQVMVTKTSILGFGMNFQHCARMNFVGMSHSYQSFYQAVRRCHRFGQERQVHVYLTLSDLESSIAANVARKEKEAGRMIDRLVTAMRATWLEGGGE